MLENKLPKGGVQELLKSFGGRRYLADLRKRFWKELLQPSDPRFWKVYGPQIKKSEEKRKENVRISKKLWKKVAKARKKVRAER